MTLHFLSLSVFPIFLCLILHLCAPRIGPNSWVQKYFFKSECGSNVDDGFQFVAQNILRTNGLLFSSIGVTKKNKENGSCKKYMSDFVRRVLWRQLGNSPTKIFSDFLT